MRFTKREMLCSVGILAILLVVGLLISSKINDRMMDSYQEYNTALHIVEDPGLFRYGMNTNVGNAFVYGELAVVDPVTFDELNHHYSYIKKVKERYTQHSRTVTYTTRDSQGHTTTHTRVEHYWTWDEVDYEDKHSTKITFLGLPFKYEQITFPSPQKITTIRESSRIRYVYYGAETSYHGTLYTVLENANISQARFYNAKDIETLIKELESKTPLVVFWVVWILLEIIVVMVFARFENAWLEDDDGDTSKRKR